MKIFIEKGDYAPKEGLEYTKRNNVALIIKYIDKYIALKWNDKLNYKSLVTGGIDSNETVLDAAVRELKEETGYYDIKTIKEINAINKARFYVAHKNQNREATYYPVIIELKSLDMKEISKEELEEHEIVWLTKEEIRSFGMYEEHVYMFDKCIKEIKNT